jgi:hypothetical protein
VVVVAAEFNHKVGRQHFFYDVLGQHLSALLTA